MHSKSKISAFLITGIVVIVTIAVGVIYGADSRYRIAAALTNLSAYIHSKQCHTLIREITLVIFLCLLVLWRSLMLKRFQD